MSPSKRPHLEPSSANAAPSAECDSSSAPTSEHERVLSLQRVAGNRAVTDLLQPGHPNQAPAGGRPIPDRSRGRLEQAFDADLSGVQIETDSAGVRDRGALAVTESNTISFAPGTFAPDSPAGFHLLAHETAHVVQQATADHVESGANRGSAEQEAWRAADGVVAGHSASVAAGQVVPASQAADGPSPLAPRPFAIEMDWTPGASSTSELGFKRDDQQFWRRYAAQYPDHMSPENLARIQGKDVAAPRVDKTWIQYYPQDALYEGDVLEHHHTGQSSRGVGVPQKLHDAYTSLHPRGTIVAEPGGPPATQPLDPLPTAERTEKEIARHTKEGRIRTADGKPPAAPNIPSTSELMSLPEGQRRPIDTADTVTIGGQTYPAERAAREGRYPRAKYTPSPVTGEPKPNSPLVPLTPAQEQDWSGVHPGQGPSPLHDQLAKAPKRGGKTIQLGKATPAAAPPTAAPAAGPPGPTPAPAVATAPPKPIAVAPAVEASEAQHSFLPQSKKMPQINVNAPEKPFALKNVPRAKQPLTSSLTSGALEEAQLLRAGNRSALVAIGVGLAAGFAMEKYVEWLREAVANMPQPEVDPRPMGEYLRGSASSIQLLDLISNDVGGLAPDVENRKDTVIGRASSAVFLVSQSSYTATERLNILGQLDTQVSAVTDDLTKLRGGIDAALALEPEVIAKATAATDLANMILHREGATFGNTLVWDQLVNMGFSIEDIQGIEANLRAYARRLTRALRDFHALQDRVEAAYLELAKFSGSLNRLYWSESIKFGLSQPRKQQP